MSKKNPFENSKGSFFGNDIVLWAVEEALGKSPHLNHSK
jgi:hypothetical protein